MRGCVRACVGVFFILMVRRHCVVLSDSEPDEDTPSPAPAPPAPAERDGVGQIFGCTDLRISVSKAKFDARADGDVRLAVRRPKPHKNSE